MLRYKVYFFQLRHCFEIPNVENTRNWVTNLVFKFHNDPTVNEFEIVVFLRQIWWSVGEREGFGRKRGKLKMREKGGGKEEASSM